MKSIRYDTMLAKAFTNLVKEEFTDKHLSGNLKANTEAHPSCYYSTIVYIKPYAYYQYEFIKNHKLIFDTTYSYAENVNQVGGQVLKKKTGNKKNYVKICLKKAIKQWHMKVVDNSLGTIKGKYNRSLYKFMKYKKGE